MKIHNYNISSCSAETLLSLHTHVRSENIGMSQSSGWTSLFDTGLTEMCTFNISDLNNSERVNTEIKVANKTLTDAYLESI